MWEILVSRKFAIRDEPNVRFRCSSNFHFSLVLPMKNTRLTTTPPSSPPSPLPPSPCIHSKRPRVCLHACMLKTHVRVVPAYTGVFNVSHTTHHTPPQPPHHTETDTERETETRREEETKEKKTEKTRQQEERTEKIHFQCGGAWPLLVGVVIFCSTMSSTIHFRFQCPLANQQFLNICELIFLCSYSFHFYFEYFFLLMQLQFQIFPNYFFMQLQFFFPELILHKFSVEGYVDMCTCSVRKIDQIQTHIYPDFPASSRLALCRSVVEPRGLSHHVCRVSVVSMSSACPSY